MREFALFSSILFFGLLGVIVWIFFIILHAFRKNIEYSRDDTTNVQKSTDFASKDRLSNREPSAGIKTFQIMVIFILAQLAINILHEILPKIFGNVFLGILVFVVFTYVGIFIFLRYTNIQQISFSDISFKHYISSILNILKLFPKQRMKIILLGVGGFLVVSYVTISPSPGVAWSLVQFPTAVIISWEIYRNIPRSYNNLQK